MTRKVPLGVRAVGGALLLAGVLFSIIGYVGDYRSAKRAGASSDVTSSVDATGASVPDTSSGNGLGAMQPAKEATGATVVVQIEGLNLRVKPESDAEVIRGLARGEKLRWVSSRTGWYQVTDRDSRTGWISSNPQYATLEK